MRRFFNYRKTLTESKTINEWVFVTPNKNNTVDQTASNNQITTAKPKANIVTIVYDYSKHKLRAQADDGIHGIGNVAFPNDLRNKEGQQYEVENLIWNGKNYRVSGNITPINNTQNTNETFNRGNFAMNFQSTLVELDKLYEELPAKEIKEKVIDDTEILEACNKSLTEADDEEEVLIDDESVVDDEVVKEEPNVAEEASTQLVLECVECNALVIKDEADITVDEDTGLVNTKEACQYCEAEKGYKNIGTFTPHKSGQELEELFDLDADISLNLDGGTGNDVSVLGH